MMQEHAFADASHEALEPEVSEQPLADLQYHLLWATRRRRPFLHGDVLDRTVELLVEAADAIGVQVSRVESGSDHLIVTVEAPSDVAPALIVARLKRHSASWLRREFTELRALPSIWTRRFLATTRPAFPPARVQAFVAEQPRNERRRYAQPLQPDAPARPPGVEVVHAAEIEPTHF